MPYKSRLIALFTLLLLCQLAEAVPQYAFRISFTDKAGSPSLSNPLVFLSQRSLNRRTAQGLTLNTTDQPVSPLYIDTVLTVTQGKMHVVSKWLNTCVILLTDSTKILLIQNKPYISNIQYVGYYPTGLHNKPGNGENGIGPEPVKKTTGTPAYYGPAWDQTNMVHGDCLHDKGFMGQGKIIAVLDDGFLYVNSNPGFDSLYKSGRIVDKYNFVKADTQVYNSYAHGTEVLSTMAGYVPNAYVGAAPKAMYALYITEDQGTEQPVEMDNMVAGFERADSLGADVVSSSLGYDVFFSPVPYSIPNGEFDGKTTPAARGANFAVEKGMLLVITMGNEGSGGILTPGDADSVITVGSVDISKNPAGSSGWGPNAASIVKPDICMLGQPGYGFMGTFTPVPLSGTSIATPQAAGFAACLWQSSPSKNVTEIKSAILKSADHYSNPVLPQLGYGVPDFCAAFTMLDINDPDQTANISVYPNPLNSLLNIRVVNSHGGNLQVILTDITGKIVYSYITILDSGFNELKLPLPGMASGLYLARIRTNNETRTYKLIRE
jgi:serine protease AprX